MLKFYILISSDTGCLWRHFSPDYSALPKEHTEVIINTTSKQDERDLVQFCNDFDISYTVTKSNGTPGKGKNSVLEIFSKSSYDYCVQIDGDDLLTPHGVELYQQIAESENAPDAICLKNQVAMIKSVDSKEKNLVPISFFTVTGEQLNYSNTYKDMLEAGLDPETADNFISYKKEFHKNADKYIEENETHCRVVFFSRKAAKYKFLENIMIGEDTLHYYELKNAHMLKEIEMQCNDEFPATYIYYLHPDSVVHRETNGLQDLTWMKDFNASVLKLEEEDKLWDTDLPPLRVNYISPPCMDDYGVSGGIGYLRDGRVVKLPANADSPCIEQLWASYSTPFQK